jgi:hypothetical protein
MGGIQPAAPILQSHRIIVLHTAASVHDSDMSSIAARVTSESQSSGGRNLIRVVIWEPGASRNTDAAKAILSGNNPSQNVQIFSNAPSLVNASRNNPGNVFYVPTNMGYIRNKQCCQNIWPLNIMVISTLSSPKIRSLTSDSINHYDQATAPFQTIPIKEPIVSTYSGVKPVVSGAFHRSCKRWLTAQRVSLLPSAAVILPGRCAQIPASPRLSDPHAAICKANPPTGFSNALNYPL